MKKYDLCLAGAIVVIALVWFLINTKFSDDGRYVCVFVNNKPAGKYDLSIDSEYIIFGDDGKNMQSFEIKNGTVDVISAACPDGLCIHQRAVSKTGETIVCLPQKIVLTVEGDDGLEVTGGLIDSDGDGDLKNVDSTENLDAVTY